jgi:hypothetical protein
LVVHVRTGSITKLLHIHTMGLINKKRKKSTYFLLHIERMLLAAQVWIWRCCLPLLLRLLVKEPLFVVVPEGDHKRSGTVSLITGVRHYCSKRAFHSCIICVMVVVRAVEVPRRSPLSKSMASRQGAIGPPCRWSSAAGELDQGTITTSEKDPTEAMAATHGGALTKEDSGKGDRRSASSHVQPLSLLRERERRGS